MAHVREDIASALGRMGQPRREHLETTVKETYRNGPELSEPATPAPESVGDSGPPTPARRKSSVAEQERLKKRRSFQNSFGNVQDTTIFDSLEWRQSTAFGLWVLFWTVIGISSVRIMLTNILKTGYPLSTHIFALLWQDIEKVALVDGAMYLSNYVTYFLARLIARGYISYDRTGWLLQHLWQLTFLLSFIAVARWFNFCWIAQIFLVLHSLTFLMQQYSYATYNGHLDRVTRELAWCRAAFDELPKADRIGDVAEELEARVLFNEEELDLQSKKTRYPDNVNLRDFFWFTMYPTLIYQLEYPRTHRIRWGFLFSKLAATFGILFLLIMQSEQHLYPIAIRAVELRNTSLGHRLREYPQILLDMMPAFFVSYLLTFYLIWDAVLNSLAELTYFKDRTFYRDWWNSSSWDKFARDWNVPVHNFLLRHVYFSSISSLKLSKMQATLLTFILSAAVHELTMYVIFGRVRGYLLTMQLMQLPLEMICRTKFMRKRPVLGLVNFWIGICLGPSLLCSLYLTF